DKKHFLTLSRGSIFESVALMQQVFDQNQIDSGLYQELYEKYEQASKMLLGMFRSYDK
ncbi:MAG: four helix bundle protein, partial [Bacteroidales bacterium]|nr:four helix bundle protein [Bacteroidales bacterium]